jgi:methyl-accepting chemotaxis protein
MLDGVYRLHKAGKITFEEAQYQGKEIVRYIRYGTEGYFWIDTYDGTNVMHAYKPEIEGKNRIDSKDIKGKLLIKEIIENGRKPGGDFTDFYFTKGNGNVPYPKRGYSLSFEPFGWVIGTGNYRDQIEETVKREERYYSSEIRRSLIISAVVFFLVALISFFVSRYYARKHVTVPLNGLVSAFKELSGGDGDLSRRIILKSEDELSELAGSFNTFAGKIRDVVADVILSADDLASGSAEVSASTVSFSENSQNQASSAEEVSASTEEVSHEVEFIAELAVRQ